MWVVIAITGYFLLAITNTIDKYLLSGPLLSPKVYSFFVGMLSVAAVLLIPFGVLEFPGAATVLLAIGAGAVRVGALFVLFSGLRKFEVSRIVPALGGAAPIFTLILVFALSGEREVFSGQNFPAFVLLVAGSIGVTLERKALVTVQSLLYAACAALLFSVFFVLAKFVYEAQSFLSGLVWIALGSFLASFVFLGFKEVRDTLHKLRSPKKRRRPAFQKLGVLVAGNQIIGGSAIFLQSLAVALVPFGLLPFVNALEGVTYFFLFVITLFLSLYFPSVLKESSSPWSIAQKVISIILIGAGLALLAA
ncbi:MAG TPA: hypothetical protein VFE94_02690 [Candidatus Paceibacterota bacterium]|nr:hypothetical protein [Candidatus Paceibacterota bacterium]